MQAWYVEPGDTADMWARFRPQALKALRHGAGQHMTEDYYLQALESGDMAMIAVGAGTPDAIGIFSTLIYPSGKVLFVELLAGHKLSDWLPFIEPVLKQYRDQIGATTIEASCRPGLAKKLTNWKRKAVLMELSE
jgi:hypothetical protein